MHSSIFFSSRADRAADASHTILTMSYERGSIYRSTIFTCIYVFSCPQVSFVHGVEAHGPTLATTTLAK